MGFLSVRRQIEKLLHKCDEGVVFVSWRRALSYCKPEIADLLVLLIADLQRLGLA